MLRFLYQEFVDPKERGPIWYGWAGASIVSLWIFFWWSIGMVPAFGNGFARADDVKGVKVYLMEETLLDARIRHCLAPKDTNQKSFYYTLMMNRATEYRDTTGTEWRMPKCEDVVYGATS